MAEIENTGRLQKRRGNPAWTPGISGNPGGRPLGTRNKATLAVEALLDGEAETLTRKAIELAIAGDLQALRICMERICPPRKDRPVAFALPTMNSAADAVKANAAIVAAVGAGDLSPMEAGELARVVEGFTSALKAEDFEQRLSLLEQKTMN